MYCLSFQQQQQTTTTTTTNKMVPISTVSSSRSFTSTAAPTAFAVRRSSRASAVPRPTRGVCSPASGGRSRNPSFTRRSYTRAGEIYYRNNRPSVVASSNATLNYENHNILYGRDHSSGFNLGGSIRNASSLNAENRANYDDKIDNVTEISSSRGRNAVSLLPVYLTDARAVTKYDPVNAPNGALQLSVAENQMLEDLLVPALQRFSQTVDENDLDIDYEQGLFQSDQIYYQPTHGREGLREAMAGYLERILKISKHTAGTVSLDRDGLVLGAGCNAVLENLCFCLTEPGDAVLLPTPYYAAFEFDLVARAALNIIPVNTMEYNAPPSTSANSIPQSCYYPNTASLDAAYEKAKESGSQPKILLLSHPNNPLGICYPPSVVKECIDWARSKKVHLVSDEIYAGSVYRKTNPLSGEDTFQSALAIAAEDRVSNTTGLGLGPYVHFVYALSKDFALSGLRVGVAYSENEAIRLPMQKLNDLCQISSQTQQTVERMLSASCGDSDENGLWSTDDFLPQNNERIKQRSDSVQLCLGECDIPCLFGDSGLFLWMDLTQFLTPLSSSHAINESEESKDSRERKLYLELMNEFGLLFTPGRSMRNELPGFFRFVFTAASDEEFDLGLKRIKSFVDAKREEIKK